MILLHGPRTERTPQHKPVKTTAKEDPRRKLLDAGAKSRAEFPSKETYAKQDVPVPQE